MPEVLLRIASAHGGTGRKCLRQRGEMRRGQLHIARAERLGQPLAAPRADQRHDVGALGRDPGDRDLRRRGADLA